MLSLYGQFLVFESLNQESPQLGHMIFSFSKPPDKVVALAALSEHLARM